MKTLTFKRNILIYAERLAVSAADLFSFWLSNVNSPILNIYIEQIASGTLRASRSATAKRSTRSCYKAAPRWSFIVTNFLVLRYILNRTHICGESRGCRWPTCRLLVHRLQDQTANIICRENELRSRHIVFLIARLHHVQSQPKQNNCQRLPHLCGASARRGGAGLASWRWLNAKCILSISLVAAKLVPQPHSFMCFSYTLSVVILWRSGRSLSHKNVNGCKGLCHYNSWAPHYFNFFSFFYFFSPALKHSCL